MRKLLNSLANRKWLSGLNCLGILLLFVALRWNNFDAPLVRDEGEYAYAAQILSRGMPPYRHSFLQKPPMVIYSYALAQAILPNTFWAPRLLAYFCVAAATVLLGLIARIEFGLGFAFPTMWLFTAMVILPQVQQFTANTEMFLLLPLMGTVAICVFSLHKANVTSPKRQCVWSWFLGGILAGITIWYKYTAMPVVAAIFVAWSIRQCQQDGLLASRLRELALAARRLLPCWLAAIVGGFVASFATLGFFIIKGGLRELWECTVVFNCAYATSATFSFSSLWFCLELLWNSWWPICLLPLVLMIKPGEKVWFWALLFFGSLFATGASIYGHYYILITPFWALLAVLATRKFAGWLARALRCSSVVAQHVVTLVIIFVVCFSHFSWVTRSKTEFSTDRLRTGNPFIESALVARRVVELTSPSDYVYVAGSEPQILYYARRISPTRFVIAYPLMFATPLAEKYQQEAIRELQQQPPAVIVLARSPMSWLIQEGTRREFPKYVDQLLKSGYERIGGSIAEGSNTTWKEPLPDDELAASELVVFKRKPLNQLY